MVEVLIALSIFAVVSIAIFSTFSSGLGVLRKVKDMDLAQQTFILKIERFSREVRQTTKLRKLLLSGTNERLDFGQVLDDMPCRVTYYLDKSNRCLMRNADKIADIFKDARIAPELKTKGAVFLTKVSEAKFSYLSYDLKKKDYIWSEKWEEEALPLAVKLNLTTDKQNYAQTVFLPTAELPAGQ